MSAMSLEDDDLNRRTQVVEAAGTDVARTTNVTFDAADNAVTIVTGLAANTPYAHLSRTKFWSHLLPN